MKTVNIVVVDYPTASKAAVYGFVETIAIANTICQDLGAKVVLNATIYKLEQLASAEQGDAVVLLPSTSDTFYKQQCEELNRYLALMHKQGALLASACVGSFILANGGFLDNKFCTTHWRLAPQFAKAFPKAKLNSNAIVVNEGNIITAGGLMAWLDLAFEIVSNYCTPAVAASLSKEMVVDKGYREQRFYHQFIPRFDHGDQLVLKIQNHLEKHFAEAVSISCLADTFYVSSRTLQRRFQKALGLTVVEYLQKLRLHNACQYLELSKKSIVEISYLVGYQNVNAFRKVFLREYGLTPSDFRKRFSL